MGTGSTAPDPSQTQLANEIGTSTSPRRTNRIPSGESSEVEALATPGEYIIRRVLEFSEAQVGGLNLTEWGFSPVSARNGPLMTRELFRDGSGNPIVLTLAADQRLRLIYRYKVTVSPTSPQDVSVNIGGDGPGIRTAKFLLTGIFPSNPADYFGVAVPSGQRRGDLIVADVLANATRINGIGTVGLRTGSAPLTYIHSVSQLSTTPPNKVLSFDPPVGRSRKAFIVSQTSEHLITIKSVILNSNIGTDLASFTAPCGNLVFDDGQEFTKDNQHRLFIGYWQITWGP